MHDNIISALKRDVRALERAELLGEKDEFIAIAKNIEQLAQQIISGSSTVQNAGPEEVYTTENQHKKFKAVTFLYKPVTVVDPFEGDYLLKFSEIRTSDLKYAGALDEHNNFWAKNEVLKGNVFGSIPTAIIDQQAVRKLKSAGWDEAKVEVKEFSKDAKERDIIAYLQQTKQKYLLTREQNTQSIMAMIFE